MEKEHLSNAVYKLEWIAVRNLAVVWQESQRPFKESWSKQIAKEFDPDMFDPIKVTLPNGAGIYHICEGQHRARAVEMLWGPNEMVPCLVAQESDPARAAEIFYKTNTHRSAVSKISKFKVAVTAKHEDEVNIDQIVRRNGYRVEGNHAQDTIAAVDALKFAYGKMPRTLDHVLYILRSTWSGDSAAVAAPIIKGYAVFVCEFTGHIDDQRLRDCMAKKFTPGKLLIEARGVKDTLRISMVEAVVHVLLRTYNHNCRKPLKRKGE